MEFIAGFAFIVLLFLLHEASDKVQQIATAIFFVLPLVALAIAKLI